MKSCQVVLFIGQWVYRRLSDATFTRIVLLVLLAAGVSLVLGNLGSW